MLALRNVLIKIKKDTCGTEDNPVPIIVVSDCIPGNADCKVLAGNLLQYVEEQLVTGIHVSSNQNNFSELRKLSGHSSRLKRFSFGFTSQTELEQYKFFKNEDVKKIGGHFGQIYSLLKDLVPRLEQRPQIMGKPFHGDVVIEQIVSGKLIPPDHLIKELVDTLIQTEAELIKTLSYMKKKDSLVAVKLLNELLHEGDLSICPKVFHELKVCNILVDHNILNHAFNDSSRFTWHRPILKHSFEARQYRISELVKTGTAF